MAIPHPKGRTVYILLCVLFLCVTYSNTAAATGLPLAPGSHLSDDPQVSNAGYTVRIEQITLSNEHTESHPAPGEQRVAISLSIENSIDPDLVFDEGFDEAVVLHGFQQNGPFLLWNDSIATVDAAIVASNNFLTDPIQLPYTGDSVSGQLIFSVPATTQVSRVELVFSDELFGGLTVPVVEPTQTPATPDTSGPQWQHNQSLSVSISDIEIEDDALNLVLLVAGGQPIDSAATEPGTVIATNLSGLRLLIPGHNPLVPDFVPEGSVQSHLPIVSVPGTVVRYPISFTTTLASTAADIALVMPVQPPENQSEEPYWIIGVRGELPSLTSSQPMDAAENSVSEVDGALTTDEKTNTSTTKKSVYSPPWPEPPELTDRHATIISGISQRRDRLLASEEFTSIEPRGSAEEAHSVEYNQTIAARFDSNTRTHFYSLPVDTSAQLYEAHIIADSTRPFRVELLQRLNGKWSAIYRRTSEDVIQQLDLRERLILSIRSREPGSEYKLALLQNGDSNSEPSFEPSDSPDTTQLPEFSTTESQQFIQWHGRFDASNDIDFFNIVSTEPRLATLEVIPNGIIKLHNENGEIGRSRLIDKRSILADVLLLPGKSKFSISSRRGDGISEYAVKATFHTLPDPTHELEPNDTSPLAHRLVPDIERTGRLPVKTDRDWYFFDWPGSGPARLNITGVQNESIKIELSDAFGPVKTNKVEAGIYEAQLESRHYELNLSSPAASLAPYRIMLSHAPLPDNGNTTTISAVLTDKRSSLQPYSPYPHSITTRLTLSNNSQYAEQVLLAAHTHHQCCEVRFEPLRLNLAPGEETTINVTLLSKRDSAGRAAFPVDIKITEENQASQWLRWMIDFEGISSAEFNDWGDYPLPEELMGAWDVARIDFGAYPVDDFTCNCAAPVLQKSLVTGSNPYSLNSNLCTAALHAGLITQTGGAIRAALHARQPVLAGSEKNGIKSQSKAPDALSVKLSAHEGTSSSLCPKRFEFSNKSSVELLSGLATTRRFEGQNVTIALAAPSSVKGFILNTHGTGLNQAKEIIISLSQDGDQFSEVSRLVLPPHKGVTSVVLNEATPARFAKIQLISGYGPAKARFQLGSLKVLANAQSNPIFPTGTNLAQAHLGFEEFDNDKHSRTVAFHHKRLADINRVSAVNTGKNTMNLAVSYSRHGPYGPWNSLGEMQISAGLSAELETGRVSARYLRFTSQSDLRKNLKIQSVIESADDESYRSILAEWGNETSDAYHEWLNITPPATRSTLTSSAENPVLASVGDQYTSEVSLRTNVADYFRVNMPEGSRDLVLNFSGDPYIRTTIHIADSNGNAIENITETAIGNHRVRYHIPNHASLDQVNVKVADTPRHLAVLWDDSGSVASFIPGIQKLIRNLAFELDEAWELLQLTPLHLARHEPFLTTQWTTDPYAIAGAIRRYRATGSSKSYVTIENALELLADVNGMRALLVMTDEQGDRSDYRHNKLEKLLAEAGPTTFSFHVSGNTRLHSEQIDHMQAWSAINGGRYTRLITPDDIPDAFAKVQGWLRRPAAYTLTVEGKNAEPATLQVKLSNSTNTESGSHSTAGAVEVIFDASGSMWKKLPDGSLRINVAKQVLTDLVVNLLPDSTPFALRVFGHMEPRSCKTNLDIPLAPLDRDSTLAIVQKIIPQDRSKTPIAASLAAIEDDIGEAPGQRVVILITDGEETCDGDPQTAIQTLKAAGIDVQINIVGFDIQDDSTRRQFVEWAALGGGDYFDAKNAEQLRQSLTESLQPRYIVRNDNGDVVARGRVGDAAFELPAGHYAVNIGSNKTSQKVNLAGGTLTTVTVE